MQLHKNIVREISMFSISIRKNGERSQNILTAICLFVLLTFGRL